jgi:hypothetical protein
MLHIINAYFYLYADVAVENGCQLTPLLMEMLNGTTHLPTSSPLKDRAPTPYPIDAELLLAESEALSSAAAISNSPASPTETAAAAAAATAESTFTVTIPTERVASSAVEIKQEPLDFEIVEERG